MKLKDKMNKKSRKEQLFIMLLIYIAILGVFCITGCGGSREKFGYLEADPEYGTKGGVCFVPGCGGYCTPQWGCDSVCWAQSCTCLNLSYTDDSGCLTACDVEYYGCNSCSLCSGCIGFGGDKQNNCYGGFMKDDEGFGIMYGSNRSKEKVVGIYDDGFGCGDSYGIMNSYFEHLKVEREMDEYDGFVDYLERLYPIGE